MTYKYQNEIEDAVDVMVKVLGKEIHGKAQRELNDVYRKAEAFNRLYAEFDKGDKDLSKADFDAAINDDIHLIGERTP